MLLHSFELCCEMIMCLSLMSVVKVKSVPKRPRWLLFTRHMVSQFMTSYEMAMTGFNSFFYYWNFPEMVTSSDHPVL